MTVDGYMQKQIEISEKLFGFMKEDFSKNQTFIDTLTQTINSLTKKLSSRDEEIQRLRREISRLQAGVFDEQTSD